MIWALQKKIKSQVRPFSGIFLEERGREDNYEVYTQLLLLSIKEHLGKAHVESMIND